MDGERFTDQTMKNQSTLTNPITLAMARKISDLLAAQAALADLFHAYGDKRGLSLACQFEDEAHAILRSTGTEDMPTFELVILAKEISDSIYR